MRLLHVVPTYAPAWKHGGPIRSVHGLCRALAQRGHQVVVFTTDIDTAGVVPVATPVALDGVEVWYFPVRAPRRLYRSPAMGRALAERMRAGGAGIPGFYTRTGVGTVIAEGKEHKEFDGETYILERGIVADLAIVKAWKGDEQGNLVYRKTARNFNPNAATCGKVCIAEVEEIVPLGSLDPDGIHTPGIFVHRILQGPHEKRIEQRTIRAA